MTEQEALIRRVCLAPDDDTPRLIFADWCDDQGEQERAEFIRVQCLLASRYPPSIDDRLHCVNPWRAGVNMVSIAGVPKGTPVVACKACETCADMKRLRHLEDELLPTVGCPFPADEWMDLYDRGNPGIHWRRKDGSQCFNCVAERGFVAEVSCDCQAWLAHGPAIVRQQPITRVVLSDTTFTREGAGLREAMFRANIPVEMSQADAALLWARREAGLDVACKECHGKGYVSPGKLLPAGGFDCACPACQGTGKEVR